MPELPEVESARRLIERAAGGHQLVKVWCARDSIVFDGVSAARMRLALTGRTVHAVQRRGKYLWVELDQRPWPCFHLGMTGQFQTRDTEPLKLASSPTIDENDWPPRFTKLHLSISNGTELVMTNKRRLGRIRLQENPPGEPPINQLGFDPLLDLPSLGQFSALLTRRSTAIKTLLLDQRFAAGVGNWIADEVLYQARVAPSRKASQLSDAEVRRIRLRLKHIVEAAVRADAKASNFPRTWLFHRRWRRDTNATLGGHRIEFLTIGGRTTAWLPELQK
ncbi:MAG: DNA-formamidopyrimidine glycosylase family protein [Acidobacteriota bacterium]|nr:DNA-formamidopyrimidine glycosylase family protein [Acidobacteriota bacterium]